MTNVVTKDVTVKVTKETYEVFEGLAEILKHARAAGADGFQAVTDIPAVLMGSFNKVSAALAGLDQIDDEAKGATPEFAQTVGTGSGLIAGELLKKPA